MKRTVTNLFVLLCAAIGLIVSLVLTFKHYRPDTDIGCGLQQNSCTGILNSVYGELAHIPTALFGAAMYIVFIGLALRRKKALGELRSAEAQQVYAYANANPESSEETPYTPSVTNAQDMAARPRARVKQTDMLLWGLAAAAFAVSWWLQYVAIFRLHGFCPWCFTSATLVTLIFLTTSWDFLIDGRELTGEHKLLGGVGAFIFALLVFMYGPAVRDQYLMNKIPVFPPPPPAQLSAETIFTKETHVKGDPKAPVTVVEFADYECPACGRAVSVIDKFLADRPRDFQFGFRNMPLPIKEHKWNQEAAAAAEAAALQGKFWEMHDLLFKRQDLQKPESNFQPSMLDDWAKELGLNVEKFRADRESIAVKNRVRHDSDDGKISGLQETPTFYFIRGKDIRRISGNSGMKAIFDNLKDPLWQPMEAGNAPAAAAPQGK